MLLGFEDDKRIYEAQAARRLRGVDPRIQQRDAGTLTEFVDCGGRNAGMGEVEHEFESGKPAGDPAAHNVQCPHVGHRHHAVYLDPGRFGTGVEAYQNFEFGVPRMVMHETVRAP